MPDVGRSLTFRLGGTGWSGITARAARSARRSGLGVADQQEHGQAEEMPGEGEPVARPQHRRLVRRDGQVGVNQAAAADDPDPGLIAQARGRIAGDRLDLA